MKFVNEDEHLATQSWNRKENQRPWLFYILIASGCFVLAWVMS
jgi:hypothetical protein